MFTTENLDQNAEIHPRSPALKCQYFSIEDMNGSIIRKENESWKLVLSLLNGHPPGLKLWLNSLAVKFLGNKI